MRINSNKSDSGGELHNVNDLFIFFAAAAPLSGCIICIGRTGDSPRRMDGPQRAGSGNGRALSGGVADGAPPPRGGVCGRIEEVQDLAARAADGEPSHAPSGGVCVYVCMFMWLMSSSAT